MNIPTPTEPCECGEDVFELQTRASFQGSGNVHLYFKLSTGRVEAVWMCVKCYAPAPAAFEPDSRKPEGT